MSIELNKRLQLSASAAADFQQRRDAINNMVSNPPDISIPEKEINEITQLFVQLGVAPRYRLYASFFLTSSAFKSEAITSHHLYGKYIGIYSKIELLDYFQHYFNKPEHLQLIEKVKLTPVPEPWKNISFFEEKIFNNFSANDVLSLQRAVQKLAIYRTKNHPEQPNTVIEKYPRALQPWSHIEKQLLLHVLKYTNNLKLLAECFQRQEEAIESYGKQLLFENNLIKKD
ncbi:hypothetical protein [Gynurincola endophyticus]|uniref:hypothetical protein n=1 Tax=Gynurincola endophyticus TaxID=2479004 RepID=UPI000F8C5B1C|nr:hypothetical protein [Gynurincola endophyticus]